MKYVCAAVLFICFDYASSIADSRPPAGFECENPASVTLHIRMLSLQTELLASEKKWTVESDGKVPSGDPITWDVIIADLDADGRSELIISDNSSDGIFVAIPAPGSKFKIGKFVAFDMNSVRLRQALILYGRPGECGKILVPPSLPGTNFRMLTGGFDLNFTRIPSMVRSAEDLKLSLYERTSQNLSVVESDIGPPRFDYFWRYSNGMGWVEANVAPKYFALIGGYSGIGRDIAGFKAIFTNLLIDRDPTSRVIEAQGDYIPEVFTQERSAIPYHVITADVDGDGVDEHILIDKEVKGRSAWISKRFPSTIYSAPLPGVAEITAGARRFGAGDFDGDGDEEILVADKSGLRAIEFEPKRSPSQEIEIEIDGKREHLDHFRRVAITARLGQVVRVSVLTPEVRVHELGTRDIVVSRANQAHGIFLEESEDRQRGNLLLSSAYPEVLFPCMGFNRMVGDVNIKNWGRSRLCPFDYVALETDRAIESGFTCCRAPAGLLKNSQYVWQEPGMCGTGRLLTGTSNNDFSGHLCPSCKSPQINRCTDIDVDRYEILPVKKGQYWGPRLDRQKKNPISQLQIPLGLRAGFSRTSIRAWNGEGCLGQDWGSILVGRFGKDCSEAYFAKVVPKSPNGVAPVSRIFPVRDCAEEPDLFLPESGCKERSPISSQASESDSRLLLR